MRDTNTSVWFKARFACRTRLLGFRYSRRLSGSLSLESSCRTRVVALIHKVGGMYHSTIDRVVYRVETLFYTWFLELCYFFFMYHTFITKALLLLPYSPYL